MSQTSVLLFPRVAGTYLKITTNVIIPSPLCFCCCCCLFIFHLCAQNSKSEVRQINLASFLSPRHKHTNPFRCAATLHDRSQRSTEKGEHEIMRYRCFALSFFPSIQLFLCNEAPKNHAQQRHTRASSRSCSPEQGSSHAQVYAAKVLPDKEALFTLTHDPK